MDNLTESRNGKPFYSRGLRFDCVRCSRCCRFTPGYVFLSEKDLSRIAVITKLSVEQVKDRYCRVVDLGITKRLSLIEKSNLDCIFWEDGVCTIYQARPLQCESYPFWQRNLESVKAWESTARYCPGIGHGRLHSRREIEHWLKRRQKERLLSMDTESMETE